MTRDDVATLAGESGLYLVPVRRAPQCSVAGSTGFMRAHCCPCDALATCPIVAEARARGPVTLAEHAQTLDVAPAPDTILARPAR